MRRHTAARDVRRAAATRRIRSSTARRIPRSSSPGPRSSATRRSRSHGPTTASTARSGSRTRRSSPASPDHRRRGDPRRRLAGPLGSGGAGCPAPGGTGRRARDAALRDRRGLREPLPSSRQPMRVRADQGGRTNEPLPPAVLPLETVAELNEGLVCLSGCARDGLALHPARRRPAGGRVRPGAVPRRAAATVRAGRHTTARSAP